jgi:hypothetical protein
VLRWSLSFAAATSFTSSPYVKALPDNECTTAVLCASCFLIASNMGRLGSVDAILAVGKGAYTKGLWDGQADKGILCRVRVRVTRLHAHMAAGDFHYHRGCAVASIAARASFKVSES